MEIEVINEIREVVKSTLIEFFRGQNKDKTYTVNQIAKRLGVSHATITKRIGEGVLETTKDGRISEEQVEAYLKDGFKRGRRNAG